MSVSFFVSFLLMGVFFWWRQNLQPANPAGSEKVFFTVNKGEGLSEISDELKKAGLVKSSLHFRIYAVFVGVAQNIQAGGYSLSPSMQPKEIAGLLTKGVNDQWVTIVEGLRSEEIGEILIRNGFALNPAEWEAKIKTAELEGQLFPDSYLVFRGSDQEKILQIFARNFRKKVLEGLKTELSKSDLSLQEVLILASIVEREAKHDSDRGIIAGILVKRLADKWPLQVDATVQYALGSLRCSLLTSPCDWWPNRLSKDDLQIDSPFNTYLNSGLPPGAICNPGLASIKAVLQPKNSDYWFYLSDSVGVMRYARNSAEHSANIKKYLLTN